MLCCKVLISYVVHLDLNMITIKSLKLSIVLGHMFMHRSLEVWGSPEALAREKKLRKEAEIEYRESKYISFKAEFIGKCRCTSEILQVQVRPQQESKYCSKASHNFLLVEDIAFNL